MDSFIKLFGRTRSVIIGMIHVRALPGAPNCNQSVYDITQIALKEAEVYRKANLDGILLENMHDRPWQRSGQLGPETTAAMAAICTSMRRKHPGLPLGVQVLAGGNREALAIAKATGLNFVRAEGFVYAHISDRGLVDSCAADIIRYRKYIGAEDVAIYTDIKKKHCSHAITDDVGIKETARAAELFMSDGIIISGSETGMPTDPQEIKDVQSTVKLPVFAGSGVTTSNLDNYIGANAIIIGSHLKFGDQWFNELEPEQVSEFVKRVEDLRIKMAEAEAREASEAGTEKGLFAEGE